MTTSPLCFRRCVIDLELSLQAKSPTEPTMRGPLTGDVSYSVNGVPVDSVDLLRSMLEDLKTADAIALQVERLGSLHYLVLETER